MAAKYSGTFVGEISEETKHANHQHEFYCRRYLGSFVHIGGLIFDHGELPTKMIAHLQRHADLWRSWTCRKLRLALHRRHMAGNVFPDTGVQDKVSKKIDWVVTSVSG